MAMGSNRIIRFLGPVHQPRRMLGYSAISVVVIAGTIAVEELLRVLHLENVELALLFVLSTFLISYLTTSYLINVASAILNTFLYDFLVTTPRLGFSFTIGFPITLFIMLLVCIITSTTTTKIKEQMVEAQQQERRTELTLEISQKMNAAESIDAIVRIAADYLSLYAMPGVFYLGNPLDGQCVDFPAGSTAPPAGEALREAHRFYAEPALCREHNAGQPDSLYIPVVASGKALGVIALQTGRGLVDKNKVAFAHILAGQAALAMELRRVTEERAHNWMMAEKEKTRSNLLRAISHDLRTPLTGILSASSLLVEQTGSTLAEDIRSDSEWLIHMVENLLMITRISDDGHQIVKKDEIAEEVIAKAAATVRKRIPGCNILVGAPDELVIVSMDAMLISQVFINLLENAVKYSPEASPVSFDMHTAEGMACFTISDSGSGLSEALLGNLFDQHMAGNHRAADSGGGMGLGLSICKTIIEAHGGTILGENKREGGALFTVQLPLNN